MFGQSIQKRLHQSTAFLVGAGAIGCEMLKSWAMMGVSCEELGGTTFVTDMDIIEKVYFSAISSYSACFQLLFAIPSL